MAAILDPALGAQRAAEIAANAKAMGIPHVFAPALYAFGPRGQAQLAQIRRDAYVKALKAHDWAFEFSDDADTYRAGRESLAQLKLAQRELDSDFALWNQHCHPCCKNGAAYQ